MSIVDAYTKVGLKRNISHFANMVKIALSDKNISPEEIDLLNKIAKKYNISEEKFKDIIKNPEKVPTIAYLDCLERIEKLFDLITMVYSDHKKVIEEENVLEKIVVGIGFPLQNVDKIVKRALELDIKNVNLEQFTTEILKVNKF